MPLWGFVLCFITATLWAASPILVNRGLVESDSTMNEINPIRSISFLVLTFLAMIVTTKGNIQLVTDARVLAYVALNVLLGYTIGDLFYFMAIRIIGVSLAVPIANSYPILVTLTSWVMIGERVTAQVFFGVAIVVSGLIALRLGAPPDEDTPSPLDKPVVPGKARLMKGFLFAIVAAVAWSFSAPLNKLALNRGGLTAMELTFYRACAFFLITWAIRLFSSLSRKKRIVPLRNVNRKAWLYFSAAAAVGLCFGSILYATCLRVMPVAVVTAITSTSPFMAALFGHFVMKERLTLVQWSGVVLIIAGSVAVTL